MFEFFPGETPEIRSHNNSDNISNVNNVVNNINNGNSNITYDNVVNKSNDINNDIVNNNNNNVSNNNNNNIQNYRNMIDNNSNDNNVLDNDKVYRMLMKTKSYHSETPSIQSQTQIKSENFLTFGGSVIDKIEQKEGNFIKGNREPNYEIGNSGETFQIDESKEDSLLKLNKLLKENCKNDFGGHSQIPEKNPIFCLFPEKISTQVEVGGEVKKFDEMRNVLKNTNVRNVLQNVIPSNINTSTIHKNDININNNNLIDVHTNLDMNRNLRTTIRTGKIHDEKNIFVNQDIGISDHLVPPISFSENNKDSNNYLSRFDEDPSMCEEISKTNFDIFLEGEGEGEIIEEGDRDGDGHGDGDGDGDGGRSGEAILEEIDTFDGYLN